MTAIAIEWERDTPDDVLEARRQRGRSALDALDRLFIHPTNSRTTKMRAWHRGIYRSYTNMAVDIYDWKPMEWQVALLEEMVALYSSVATARENGRERLTL